MWLASLTSTAAKVVANPVPAMGLGSVLFGAVLAGSQNPSCPLAALSRTPRPSNSAPSRMRPGPEPPVEANPSRPGDTSSGAGGVDGLGAGAATHETVTGALVADSASQVTVAVRTTSAPLVVVRPPVQLVLAPGSQRPGGGTGQGDTRER